MRQIGIAAFPEQRQSPVIDKPFSALLTCKIFACRGDFRDLRGGGRSGERQSKQDSMQISSIM
jgi:hypothetical protein